MPPHYLYTFKHSAAKVKCDNACIVYEHFKSVSLRHTKHNIWVKRYTLFGRRAILFEGHGRASLGEVKWEVIATLLLRDTAKLRVIGNIMECTGYATICHDRKVIPNQFRDLFPQ